jgi:hypothetical protein
LPPAPTGFAGRELERQPRRPAWSCPTALAWLDSRGDRDAWNAAALRLIYAQADAACWTPRPPPPCTNAAAAPITE